MGRGGGRIVAEAEAEVESGSEVAVEVVAEEGAETGAETGAGAGHAELERRLVAKLELQAGLGPKAVAAYLAGASRRAARARVQARAQAQARARAHDRARAQVPPRAAPYRFQRPPPREQVWDRGLMEAAAHVRHTKSITCT